MRSRARRLFKFAQRFSTSTLGQKINLVWGKKSPVAHRKNFKEFLDFPKVAPQHSRGSCVRWKRCIKPKYYQQILDTRRFTRTRTVLRCASSTQFHLGTDVRYHYVPKYTVLCFFFKIAVHWKKLASSNSLQQRRNYHKLRCWAAIWPHPSAKVPGLLGKIKKKLPFCALFWAPPFFYFLDKYHTDGHQT